MASVLGYETDYLSSQVDPVPEYLHWKASKTQSITPVPGTIYERLDSQFSIFKRIINQSVYKDLLNNLEARVTLFAVPDQLIPKELHQTLANLDYGDAQRIIQCHIIDEVRVTSQLTSANLLIPTKPPVVHIQTKKYSSSIHPWGMNSQQMINLLNSGNKFRNGIVIVIDQLIIP
jgi:hypothetical protein